LGLLTLFNRRRFLKFICIFRIVNSQTCPKQLTGVLVQRKQLHGRSLRNKCILIVKTSSGQRTVEVAVSKVSKLIIKIINLKTYIDIALYGNHDPPLHCLDNCYANSNVCLQVWKRAAYFSNCI